ncbi:MAG: mechanosensitive ion channel family protein [Wenzhouxiangellaceae bacterium]|nr:mechanosensitive ion channel family protein [Wenzhouxiangellaceae bacterium]
MQNDSGQSGGSGEGTASESQGQAPAAQDDSTGISEPIEAVAEKFDVDVAETLAEQVEAYAVSLIESLPNLIAALIVLALTFLFAKVAKALIRKALQRANVRRALISLSRTLTDVVVWALGILVAMAVLFPSVQPSSILTAMGVGGIAIGFAFKDIFENFMAGAMIMLRKPMRIGDYIECEGVEGEVEDILIRDTYIRKNDGQLVMVPNAMLYKNPVYVLTDRRHRRFEIITGVAYDTDVDEARDIIRDAVESVDHVDDERGIDVFACEFNESSIDFRVRWWTESSPRDGHVSTDLVIAAIKRALDEAGIEIPFPYRTLTFAESLQFEQVEDAANDEDPHHADEPEDGDSEDKDEDEDDSDDDDSGDEKD